MTRIALFVAACAALVMSPAFAHDYTVGTLKIDHPWARATPKGASVGGGYFKITNTGTAPDRLVSGTSGASKRFEIHEMSVVDGIMKMREMPKGIEIKPGETIEFKPGGYHVMFMDLNRPLTQGDEVKATLKFEKAGPVDVVFKIEGIGAQTGGGPDMGNMKHGH